MNKYIKKVQNGIDFVQLVRLNSPLIKPLKVTIENILLHLDNLNKRLENSAKIFQSNNFSRIF